ncbi:hypothetical protein, partial [Bacillus pseudomycoides]|uniref:hypothetical protein n=1 Tax=Bacillus pseudomycoides TaxID=64104 RepID=UPI000BEBB27A
FLRDLARDVGFVQRTSKYQEKDLVALCVWISQNVAKISLTQWYQCIYDKHPYSKTDENLIDMRRKQSLIY